MECELQLSPNCTGVAWRQILATDADAPSCMPCAKHYRATHPDDKFNITLGPLPEPVE